MKVITLTIVLVLVIQKIGADIDLRYLDEAVDPCDNFYEYACGNFKKYHRLGKNQKVLDLFILTEEELTQTGKKILEQSARHDDPISLRKARGAYKACVDTLDGTLYQEWYYQHEEDLINSLINGCNEKISLTEIGEFSAKFGIHHFFEFTTRGFSPDDYLFLMLPDSQEEPEMIRPTTKKTYDQVIEESFKKFKKTKGRLLTARKEDDYFDIFLDKVLEYVNSKVSLYNGPNLKNDLTEFSNKLFDEWIVDDDTLLPSDVTTLGGLQEWSDQVFGNDIEINWVDYFNSILKWSGVEVTEDFMVYIMDTKSTYGILNLLRQTDPLTVKIFMLVRTFMYMAPDSGIELRTAFKEYYTSLGLEYYEKEEYCTRKILDLVDTASISFAVAYDFVHYHFNINNIQKAVQIIQDVNEVFKKSVKTSNWVDKQSHDAISRKLDNIEVFLAYPEFVENRKTLDEFYGNLEICKWDHYGNSQRIRAFRQAYKLTEYYNFKNFSGKSPFEVNAYANQASMRIMAPLPMVYSSFLSGDDAVFDYSRFGSVIAHEFVHHFDKTGVIYNEEGIQTSDFISNSTMEVFKTRTQCLIDQYNQYYVEEIGRYVSGESTLNENLADNGGLRHAWMAFKNKRNTLEKPKKNFTLEQLFFINFATTYCSIESPEYLENLVLNNNHSPSRFRILGTLSNMDEFASAFKCKKGSNMNRTEKCIIW